MEKNAILVARAKTRGTIYPPHYCGKRYLSFRDNLPSQA